MQRFFRWIAKHIPLMLSLGLLAFAVALKAGQFNFVVQLQYKVFDAYQTQFPREYVDAGVRIVDIDEESLAKLGQWPWPRQVVAELIQRLMDMGAAVVAFDIVFAEPDRTSPKNMAEIWNGDAKLNQMLQKLPDHDQMLADVIKDSRVVTGFVLNNDEAADKEDGPTKKFGLSFAGVEDDNPSNHLLHFSGSTTNLSDFEAAASGNGFFNNTPDMDGLVRRVPLALQSNGEVYFSLLMEALRVAQGASSYLIKLVGASGEANYGTHSGITAIRNGHFEIPTDAQGNILVHYTNFVKERYIPAWEILSEDFDSSQVEGMVLFMGTSAPGLLDLRATPVNPALPGVEVHVQALEQILTNDFHYRPDWMLGAEILYMIIGGLLMIIIMVRLTAVWGAVFMLLAQIGSVGMSFYMFTQHSFLMEPISPSIVILLLYLSESLHRYIYSEAERKKVRGAFSQYMSPALVAELEKNPDRLVLGGEMKDMTVLFCDVRGFTTISERFTAEQLTLFINRFLTPMTNVILNHQGTIDKYMGDCIMAFWNAPLDDEDHVKHACIASLEMFVVLDAWNEQRKKEAAEEGWDYFPVQIGAGINTGEICVGNMGSDQRFDYSVLGDEVNLASRLEGQSKNYGVNVVIGDNTKKQVEEMATLELDLIQVKGKTEAVRIHALFGDEDMAVSKAFLHIKDIWTDVLHDYRAQQWEGAQLDIQRCRTAAEKLDGVDLSGLFDLYEERIKASIENSPPEDWDGVFRATSK